MKKLTQPYVINDTRIRLGDKGDGGYIINKQALTKCDELYSYGIENCIGFDCDWEKFTGKKSYLYDMTVNAPTAIMPNMTFFKEGISGTKTHNTNNYLGHYKQNGSTSTNILLKIDVESAEIEWLDRTDIKELAKTAYCIVLEFHWIHNNYRDGYIRGINKLKEYYDIFHIHGNNFGGYINGYPDVPEISFIRKSEGLTTTLSNEIFPVKDLDYPNNNNCQDYIIDYSCI